jgi:hypothetical protein
MANHNKNKRFGGDNFQRVRRERPVGQDALEREQRRRAERRFVRPIAEDPEDEFYSDYLNEE